MLTELLAELAALRGIAVLIGLGAALGVGFVLGAVAGLRDTRSLARAGQQSAQAAREAALKALSAAESNTARQELARIRAAWARYTGVDSAADMIEARAELDELLGEEVEMQAPPRSVTVRREEVCRG